MTDPNPPLSADDIGVLKIAKRDGVVSVSTASDSGEAAKDHHLEGLVGRGLLERAGNTEKSYHYSITGKGLDALEAAKAT